MPVIDLSEPLRVSEMNAWAMMKFEKVPQKRSAEVAGFVLPMIGYEAVEFYQVRWLLLLLSYFSPFVADRSAQNHF